MLTWWLGLSWANSESYDLDLFVVATNNAEAKLTLVHPDPLIVQLKTMGKRKKATTTSNDTRRGWTTDDQFEYLSSLVPGFLSAQAAKKTAEYWPPIFEAWFERWRLDLPTQKEVEAGKTEQDLQNAMKLVSEVLYCKIDSLTIVTPANQRMVRQPYT